MRWLRYRNEMVAAGTNSMMRRLLESGKGPILQSPLAYDLRRSMPPATHTAPPPDHTPTAPSEPPSLPLILRAPLVTYQSPTPPDIFQPESGWPDGRPVERWMHGEEGIA